jgi:hypothetical protein
MTESDVIFTNLEIIRDKFKENNIIPHYYLWCNEIHNLEGYTLDYEKFRSRILQLYATGCKLTDPRVRCDIDIPGLSGYEPTYKLWHRIHYNYWSIDIKWLLREEFMKDFESQLSQRVLYSLFQ